MTKERKAAKNNAEHTAYHYGFDLVEIKETAGGKASGQRAEEEKVKVLKYYSKENDLRRDIPKTMLFYNKPLVKEAGAKRGMSTVGLDVVGVDDALAEALIIQTALSILKEEGYKDLSIEVNAIGDRDSVKKFEKELVAYYKSRNEDLKAPERKKVNLDGATELFCSPKDYMQEINSEAPKPIYFLNDQSSGHFKEVLEYLEGIDMPYAINDTLMGNKNYFSKVIFVIKGRQGKEKEAKILARGGRYDELAGEVTRKRKISAVGLSMDFKSKTKKPKALSNKVSIHLIKIGFNAKMKSLDVLEAMKSVGVPLHHSLDEKKISHQIEHAMENDAAYALIIGQREANMGKVLVRNMETSAQDEVKVEDLTKYMKKLV